MNANIKPALDPNFMSEKDMKFFETKSIFRSEIFLLNKIDSNDDNERYQELMNRMYPFDQESNLILNPYSSILRSVDREGNILIHVEYLELHEEENPIMLKAIEQAKAEGKDGDEEYIERLYRKMGGDINSISW